MRLARVLTVLLPVLVLTLAAAYPFLPDHYEVERRIVVRARPEAVHRFVGALERWPDWTGWTEEELRRLEVTSDLPERGLWYDVRSADGKPSKGAVMHRAMDEGTAVVWIQRGALRGWRRYFVRSVASAVGLELERSLAALRARVEAEAGGAGSGDPR